MYAKMNENKVRCSNCHCWAHTKQQCRRCSKCGNHGVPSHWCWEENRGERRGVNAAELYEVGEGMPILVELVVNPVGSSNEETSVI